MHPLLQSHVRIDHDDLVQPANVTRGHARSPLLDWWPPIVWWPEPARDLIEPGSPPVSATLVLSPIAESVWSARNFALGALSGWDMTGLADGMGLVVSELVTNALRHGLALCGGPRREVIRLALIRRGRLVTCVVFDPGPGTPVLRDPSPFEPGGLGLHIVESLSVRWGWCPVAPRGKAVWAVLGG